jgi:hypothetical protein
MDVMKIQIQPANTNCHRAKMGKCDPLIPSGREASSSRVNLKLTWLEYPQTIPREPSLVVEAGGFILEVQQLLRTGRFTTGDIVE